MKRKSVNFSWENEDAQQMFAELVPFPDAQASIKDVDEIVKFVGLKSPLFILDVGCGNGRHAIELAKRGNRVVGIDVAKRFLDEAQKSARESNINVEFRLQRASEIPERDIFDFALAYWHTIGFMDDDEIKKHFSSVYAALKPKTFFLYTFQGPRLIPSQALRDAIPVKNWSEKDGKFILTEKFIQNGYRNEYCVVINAYSDEIVEYKEHQRAFSYEEIINYLKYAGFSSVSGYKNFNGEPSTPEEFNIFLCEKG